MKKNTVLAVIVVALGFALSYMATLVSVGGSIAIACVFAFSALMLAIMAKEE